MHVDPHNFSLQAGVSRNGQVETVAAVLNSEVDVNAEWEGRTPLAKASQKGHTAVADLLRSHGAHE